MEIVDKFKTFYENAKADYALIKSKEYQDSDYRNALINSLALRILGALLMTTGTILLLTGVGLISVASLGSLPTLIVSVASTVFGFDCIVIGHNQSEMIKKVSSDASASTIWGLFSSPFASLKKAIASSEDPTPVVPTYGRSDLKDTLLIQHIYNLLMKPAS